MREFIRVHNFGAEAMRTVEMCVQIIAQYQRAGLRLTLRQLYYQLVTRNAIKNEERQYKRLSGLLSDARLMGFVDWEAIEDRIRQPRIPLEFKNLEARVKLALDNYRLPRWEGQPVYAELWVEKDALAGILEPLAHEYHVPMMVNRGYSSQTAMYDSAKRFLSACYGGDLPYRTLAEDWDKDEPALKNVSVLHREALPKPERIPILFYLGDHDPSGEDMVRDIRERLALFGIEVDVRKLALTMEQVEEYNPPPNPAKMTDPRAAEYVDKHGATSWEVDALPPNVLNTIIREALDEVVNHETLAKVIAREKRDKKALEKALAMVTDKGKKKTK